MKPCTSRWCQVRTELIQAESRNGRPDGRAQLARLRPLPTALRSRFPRSAPTRSPTHRDRATHATIRRLRDRFALGLSERQAADFMMAVVKNAHENLRSTVYDEFQRVSRLGDKLRPVH